MGSLLRLWSAISSDQVKSWVKRPHMLDSFAPPIWFLSGLSEPNGGLAGARGKLSFYGMVPLPSLGLSLIAFASRARTILPS